MGRVKSAVVSQPPTRVRAALVLRIKYNQQGGRAKGLSLRGPPIDSVDFRAPTSGESCSGLWERHYEKRLVLTLTGA